MLQVVEIASCIEIHKPGTVSGRDPRGSKPLKMRVYDFAFRWLSIVKQKRTSRPTADWLLPDWLLHYCVKYWLSLTSGQSPVKFLESLSFKWLKIRQRGNNLLGLLVFGAKRVPYFSLQTAWPHGYDMLWLLYKALWNALFNIYSLNVLPLVYSSF